MSELLKLAEAYYAVAKDLERQANYYLEVARLLNKTADHACEQNMREAGSTNDAGEKHDEKICAI